MVDHKISSFRSDQANKMAADKWIILIGGIPNFFYFQNNVSIFRTYQQQNGHQMDYSDLPIFKHLLWNYFAEFNQTLQGLCMDGPAQNTTHRSGWINKIAAKANSLVWLADFQNSYPLKLLHPISPNLAWMMYGWSCTKIPLFVPIE